ncbi:MAG: hypothetical protein ABIS26_00840 [Candidatus Paceibacterota bacterium]
MCEDPGRAEERTHRLGVTNSLDVVQKILTELLSDDDSPEKRDRDERNEHNRAQRGFAGTPGVMMSPNVPKEESLPH